MNIVPNLSGCVKSKPVKRLNISTPKPIKRVNSSVPIVPMLVSPEWTATFNLEVLKGALIQSICIDAEWFNEMIKRLVSLERAGKNYIEERSMSKPGYLSAQYELKTDKGTFKAVVWNCNSQYGGRMPDLNQLLLTYPQYSGSNIVVVRGNPDTYQLSDLMEQFNLSFAEKKIEIMMFYAYPDLCATVLKGDIRHSLLDTIEKNRNLSGDIPYTGNGSKAILQIRDLAGTFSNMGLEQGFESVGMKTSKDIKALSKAWDKGHMEVPFVNDPEGFLAYSIGDTDLSSLRDERVKQVNRIVTEALGFNPEYEANTFKYSSGSLVADVFMKWLGRKYPQLMTLIEVNANPPKDKFKDFRNYLEAARDWNAFSGEPLKFSNRLFGRPNPEYEVLPDKASRLFISQGKHKDKTGLSGVGAASIPRFALSNNTSIFNAVVMGGRCNNERPFEFRKLEAFDPDLSSCYGGALSIFDYPIGNPTVYGYTQHEEPLTLGKFLSKFERELIPGLWQITVEGELSFSQDLVYSKIGINEASIRRNMLSDDAEQETEENKGLLLQNWFEASHIKGDFTLMTNQIDLGIITDQVLKTIRAVSSLNELNEWYGLKVVTAAYYPRSAEAGYTKQNSGEPIDPDVSYRAMVNALQNNPGTTTVSKAGATEDYRTNTWFRVPLSGFVGEFVSLRKRIKAQMKDKTNTTELTNELNLLQNGVKLFVNTTYGCLASPYFAMGNTILANNITAMARVGAWMMTKALGGFQTITDGCAFSNKEVRFIKPGKKPSFDTLANSEAMEKHRAIAVGTLLNWKEFTNKVRENTYTDDQGNTVKGCFKGDKGNYEAELDKTVTDHVNEFWKSYGLTIPFDIECKYEHTCEEWIYWGASDYLGVNPILNPKAKNSNELNLEHSEAELLRPDTRYIIKVRGARTPHHPKKLWLLYLAGVIGWFRHDLIDSNLIGVNEVKRWRKTGHDLANDVLPGWERFGLEEFHPRASHLPKTNMKTVKLRADRERKNGSNYDKQAMASGQYAPFPTAIHAELRHVENETRDDNTGKDIRLDLLVKRWLRTQHIKPSGK